MANTVQKESKVVYLQIGQNYEHLAETKQFDVSEWVAEFPDATIYMLFKRPGEAAVAPVQTTLEDGILTWTISNWETGIIGIGFAEIRAIDSSTGMVKKSHVIPCSIEASVTDEDSAPDYPSWVDRMITMNEHLESVYSDFGQEITDGIAAIQGEAGTQKDAIQARGNEVIASIPASYQTVLESIAPQYASGRPWPKDWFCWYNGKLYQHREDETVAGAFDPDKWYQVVFADVASEATISAKDTRTALYDIAAPEYVTWRSYHTDDYDPAEAFPAIAVGDYYIYDLQMYRCIVPIPVGGDTETWAEGTRISRKFVPEHWERVAVYTELQKYVQSDALAPEYSASTTYKAGQYVWYSGNVYRCKTDISTAEAWTAAHWRLVKIGDELTELKSATFDQLEPNYMVELVKGASANTSGPLRPFRIHANDSITISSKDGSTFGNVQFRYYDADKNYINYWGLYASNGNSRTVTVSREAYYVGITTVTLESPDAYIVVNNSNAYKQNIKAIEDAYKSEAEIINNRLDIISEQSVKADIINRFNKETITAGKYINPNTGGLVTNETFFASDFIYIGDLASVTVSYTHLFVWYDENKNHLTPNPDPMNSGPQDLTFARPEGAVYLRFSAYNDYLNTAQIGGAVSRNNYAPYGIYKLPEPPRSCRNRGMRWKLLRTGRKQSIAWQTLIPLFLMVSSTV